MLEGLRPKTTAYFQSQRQNLERAKYYLDKCRDFLIDPSRHLKYQWLYISAWNAYYSSEYDKGISLFEKAIENAEPADPYYRSMLGIGATLVNKGEWSRGLEKELESLEEARKSGDTLSYVQIILNVIEPLRRLNRIDEVEEFLQKAYSAAEEIHSPTLLARVLRQKVKTLIPLRKFKEALRIGREAIQQFEKVNDRYYVHDLLITEGQILREMGDLDTAKKAFISLWKEIHYIKNPNNKIFALMHWASLYLYQGKLTAAKGMYEKASAMAKKAKHMSQHLLMEVRLCNLYVTWDKLKPARKKLSECKRQFDQYGYKTLKRTLLFLEAEIHLKEGNPSSAIEIISGFLPLIDDKNQRFAKPIVLSIYGRGLIALGRYHEGLAKLRESVQEYINQEELYDQGSVYYSIAEAMFKHQDFSDEATSALDEAETIFTRLGAQHYLKKISELRAKHFKDLQKQMTPSLKNLEALSKINELISKRLGKDGFMDELLGITLNLTKAERGMILVAESGEFHSIASKEIDPATSTEAHRISRTIMNQVVTEQCPIYTSDALLDERFKKSKSILINDILSFICVPLKTDEGMVGTIYLDSKKTGLFKPDNLFYFNTLGNLLAPSIKRTAEYKKLREKLVLSKGSMEIDEKGIVLGSSPVIKKLCHDLEKIAGTDSNVLLEGETGSGKGVFARLIHELSDRSDNEFCCINCGILPENIFETELFGAKKGAYTGATADRKGLLEAADCSTVFFDEITNTSPALQAKLLEVIEEKIIRRMGDTKTRKVNLRFIFATNRNLEQEVREGRFREDLFFRINTITLNIPALRERREDIPEFAGFFLKEFSRDFGKDVTDIDEDALKRLVGYSWPGNVRELKNVIERLVLMTLGKSITKELLDRHFSPVSPRVATSAAKSRVETQEERVRRALRVCEGNVTRAARHMGVSRRHFYRLMERFNISRKNY